MLRRCLTTLLVSALCSSLCLAYGQGRGNSQGKANQKIERDSGDERDDYPDRRQPNARGRSQPGLVIFTPRDRDLIRDYFRGGYSNLPPGLAKRGGNLPPGLEKQLRRNGTLPPGLQKRLTPLPVDLDRRLPPLSEIYRRGTIGDSVVIINQRTQQIMDIIHGVVSPR